NALVIVADLTADTRLAGAWLIGVLLSVAGSFMSQAALFRRAFANTRPGDTEFRTGPSGLQWRQPEARLLGATLLLFILALVVGVVFIVLAAIIMVIVGGPDLAKSITPGMTPEALLQALGPDTLAAIASVYVLLALVLLYVGVRLALYSPATVAERRM